MSKKKLYGFDIRIDNNIDGFKLVAEPDTSAIFQAYSNLMEGVEQHFIDNMPVEAVRKLLKQMLKRYSQIVGMDINADIEEITAVYELLQRLEERGV